MIVKLEPVQVCEMVKEVPELVPLEEVSKTIANRKGDDGKYSPDGTAKLGITIRNGRNWNLLRTQVSNKAQEASNVWA